MKLLLVLFLLLSISSLCFAQSMAELNPGFEDRLIDSFRGRNVKDNEYKDTSNPFVLFHFSDIHGDKVELQRYVEFLGVYGKYFDDAICTGDLVPGAADQGFDFWGEVKGAEKILFVTGNHDFLRTMEGWEWWTNRLNKKEIWDQYFAKYIKNWGVTYKEGNTYYYKDYPRKKMRLIGLDCALQNEENEEQYKWFKDALTGALENDYAVIVAYHYNPRNSVQIKCNFTDFDHYDSLGSYDDMRMYNKIVEVFKAGGGKFICWLGGHTHWEQFAYNKDFPGQLYYSIDATNREQCMMYSNITRRDGHRSQDLANAMVVDTSTETIKLIRIGANEHSYLVQRNGIVINYKTFEVMSQF